MLRFEPFAFCHNSANGPWNYLAGKVNYTISTAICEIRDLRHCIPDLVRLLCLSSTAEKVGPSNVDHPEVGWVIRSARRLVEPPNPKKPTDLRGAAGVWNRKSGDRIRGCDGTRIHATNSLARVGGQSVTNVAALSFCPRFPNSAVLDPPWQCLAIDQPTTHRSFHTEPVAQLDSARLALTIQTLARNRMQLPRLFIALTEACLRDHGR